MARLVRAASFAPAARLVLLAAVLLANGAPIDAHAATAEARAATTVAPYTFTTVAGAGGVPLNVVETGRPDGPAILFLHGMSASYLAWLPQLRSTLGDRYRLVAFDLRGHGGSGKPWRPEDYADSRLWADDVAAVIAAKQLHRPVVVAWSYGGHVLMSYVRHYGTGNVAGIDFTGTLAGLLTIERQPGPETDRLLEGSKRRASADLEQNIRGYREMVAGYTVQPLPRELDEATYVSGLLHPSYVRRAQAGVLPTKNEDLVPKLDVPVLLSMGRADREWPIDRCEDLVKSLRAATLSVYENAAHYPSAEDPERFDRELDTFARRALAGTAGPVAACRAGEDAICGLPRAEDLARIPGTRWVMASTALTTAPLTLLDPGRREARPLAWRAKRDSTVGDPSCPGPPESLEARGNDVRRVGRDVRAAVLNVNAERGTRVELFSIDVAHDVPAATWLGCVPVPRELAPNDVALGDDGAFYVSHMFDRPAPGASMAALRERFLAREDTGRAFAWSRRAGWRPVPGTDVSFTNGVAVATDGRTLAVAGTYSQAVVLAPLDGRAPRRVSVPLQPDNLTPEPDGGFLVVGHTGVPVSGVDPCRDPKATPCGFPFAVARIGPDGSVQRLYEHGGAAIPGASVVVRDGTRLLLGSAFGDRVSIVGPVPVTPSFRPATRRGADTG
jgi:non-heme chloroperoxidase